MQAWSVLKISNIVLAVTILLIIVLILTFSAGCVDPTTASISSGRIIMTSQYSSTNSFIKAAPKDDIAGFMVIDSIRITRARLVLRDITYRTRSDSSNFRAEPIVLEFNLSNVIQNISMSEVPYGSYNTIEFNVHRIDTNDMNVLPSSERVQFKNFAADERYSIIVSGKIFIGGQSIVFTFRSRTSAKLKISIAKEIVISESSPEVNTTILINSSRWFMSSTQHVLDPFDVLNETAISDNIFASINVFNEVNNNVSYDTN